MSFKDIAKKRTTGSEILANRNKIDVDQIIARFPQGIKVVDFDFLTGTSGENYVVCAFDEIPESFFNGGRILTDIFTDIVASAGNLEAAKAEYVKDPITFKLTHGRTKKGNKVTLVEVVD